MLKLSITKSNLRFGYVIWKTKQDGAVKRLLGDQEQIQVIFENSDLGLKRIDWKYHRISLGPRKMSSVPEGAVEFTLSLDDKKRLLIRCE
ncbi:hypothetical protein [Rhodopirellula sallentina]|uniref:hypothetical protein n=1 Tax=Rhodopirellula sallentina TaxID=1263869 RepID=UPI0005C7DF7C|nr:hypothetical protein [Rhodopirellula sallentina]